MAGSLLSVIETNVKALIDSDRLILTVGSGLALSNMVYRSLVAKYKWPEFRRTDDLAAKTVSGSESIVWDTALPKFYGPVEVEVGSDASDNHFVLLEQPPSVAEWNNAALMSDFIPKYYKRYGTGSTENISIRPAPNYTGATVRVTGQVEPSAFTTGSSTTGFIQVAADDALVFLIASNWMMRTQPELAMQYAGSAAVLLSNLLDTEVTTADAQRIANG